MCRGSYRTHVNVAISEGEIFSFAFPAAPRECSREIMTNRVARFAIPCVGKLTGTLTGVPVTLTASSNLIALEFLSDNFILSPVIIESAYFIRQLSSCDFFLFRFRRAFNRARWHNGRSRQSPTCYHRRRQRIVKPRIVHQLRVTPRVGRVSSSRAKIARHATRSPRCIGAVGDSSRVTRTFSNFCNAGLQ